MSSEHSRGTDVLRLCPQIIHTYTVANTYTGAKDSVSIEWSVGPLRIDKGITCATGPVEGQTAPEDASMTVEQDEASLNSAYSAALTIVQCCEIEGSMGDDLATGKGCLRDRSPDSLQGTVWPNGPATSAM